MLEERPDGVGYLLKERISDPAILVDALDRIADGESIVDPTIVKMLMDRRRRTGPLDELSDREREVLALVAAGLSNEEIGERLFLSTRTVERHLSNVYAKLRLSGKSARAAAAARFSRG